MSPASPSESSVSAAARVALAAFLEKRPFLPREPPALPKVPVAAFLVLAVAGVVAALLAESLVFFLRNKLRCCDKAETLGGGPLLAADFVSSVTR